MPKAFFIALILLTALPVSANAEEVTPNDAASIRSVIDGQLAAFRRNDGEAAYAFAAPPIRQLFPNVDIFMNMVRQGYPQIFRSRDRSYGTPRLVNGKVWQIVTITGENGKTVDALYQMVKQATGEWRINGVTTKPATGSRI
jgi:hypothetical protein